MSKTVIFYFSGTGNSLAIARSIAKHLKDTAVVPVLRSDAMTSIGKDTENIGFVYPVHMNALPRTVAKFIGDLDIESKCYIFAVATHGGMPGMAGPNLYYTFKRKSFDLDAYFEVEMVMNTPKGVAPRPLMRLDWELEITPDIIGPKLKKADLQAEEIAKSVISKELKNISELESKSKYLRYSIMRLIWRMSENSKPKLDFVLDESCTGCGICEATCTANRIQMRDGKPGWVTVECNYCYACFNYCPVQAIGVKYYMKRLGRYHHPQISAVDIASQSEENEQND